jgi:hypothetical protein
MLETPWKNMFVLEFLLFNDNAKVDLENIQTLHCILCYQTPICGINSRTQVRKGLISYYKTYGITSFLKHVDVDHTFTTIFFEEVNNLLKDIKERQP